MYICNECDELFDYPATYVERHGLSPYEGPGEVLHMCPHCGAPDYRKAIQCARCGKWIAESYSFLELDENDNAIEVCEECSDELDERRAQAELEAEEAAERVEEQRYRLPQERDAQAERANRPRRNFQRVSTALCCALGVMLLGSVGAMDLELITLRQFVVRLIIGAPMLVLTAKMGGLFD